MRRIIRILLSALCSLLILVILISFFEGTEAKTIYIDDEGGKDFKTIQEGVDEASQGDTLFIHDGIYKENIVIRKSTWLKGESVKNTIVHSKQQSDSYGIHILCDNVTVENLSIKNSDGGIYIEKSHNNTIKKNFFDNNRVCIQLSFSDDNDILSNTISNESRAGIIIVNSSNNIVKNNIINSHEDTIYIRFSNNNTIRNNVCSNGRIVLGDSFDNNMHHNIISNSWMMGIFIPGSNNNKIENNTISNASWGFNICHSYNNLIAHNTISNNSIGIRLDNCGKEDNIFIDNSFINNGQDIHIVKEKELNVICILAGILVFFAGIAILCIVFMKVSEKLEKGKTNNQLKQRGR